MKNRTKLGAILPMMTAILAVAACNKNEAQPDPVQKIPYTVNVGSGDPATRATVDADNKTLRFAEGDKLYVTGVDISGVLDIQSGQGTASATFSGELTYRGAGSPADNLALDATLVSNQQESGVQVLINSTTKAVQVQYPDNAYCTSVNDAVQQYSCLTGTSTYASKSFSLTQQSAFLNFEITFADGTAAGETLPAVVSNNGAAICTANVTTVAESEKVVARFVLPLTKDVLRDATVKLGSKAVIAINTELVALDARVYNVKRTQQLKTIAEIQAEDLHKLIGADGKIYETQAIATKLGATAIARICYVGNDAETSDTYNHGLALALTDANNGEIATWCTLPDDFWVGGVTCLPNHYLSEDAALGDMAGLANTDELVTKNGTNVTVPSIQGGQETITKPHEHVAAMAARNFKYAASVDAGAHPTGTSAWFLPSAGQWKKMIYAAGLPSLDESGHYIALRELMGLHTEANSVYWTSTERIHNNGHCDYAWFHSFNYQGSFTYDFKIRGGSDNNYVRSALAF